MEEKDVWEFDVQSKRNNICYSTDSIRHPAKMELNMCREIIKRYSKKGDLVLDCMAGIGSTIVEGMILGRNVIGIEYEQKFVDMAQKNIEKTNLSMKFLNSLGKGIIIKGDSRELCKLLSEQPNRIIFSHPFVNANQGGGLNKRKKEGKLTKNDVRMGNCIHQFSEDENNIDNIKKYDSIITSPPYGHESTTTRESVHKKRDIHASRFDEINYSDDPANCRNLQGKNYLSEMKKIYDSCFLILKLNGYMVLVTKNFVRAGKQIRLDLDTIKLCETSGFNFIRRHYRKINNPSFWITNAIQKFEKKHPGEQHPYPLFEDILVFQKLRNETPEREREHRIDGIVFSPPFADQLSKGTDPEKFGNKGNWKADSKYSDNPENIGNLKYQANIKHNI